MEANKQSDGALPAAVQEGLDTLCTQLRDALGEQLVSLILYGGLAKGEYTALTSNVNVALVVRDPNLACLDKVVAPIQQGIRDLRLSVMVLGEEDLARSAAAFPIKFLDIQQSHRLLAGRDVFADLRVGMEHLRLRCAQEIQNLTLRLRQFYLQRAQRPEMIEATLTRTISGFLTSMRGVLIVKTGKAPTTKEEVAATAARDLGLDEKVLRDLLALKAGQIKPDATELKQLYDSFMSTVREAAHVVDRLSGK